MYLGQYSCWNRVYDVLTARWTTPDPAASPWTNLNGYVGNPIQQRDPTGLEPAESPTHAGQRVYTYDTYKSIYHHSYYVWFDHRIAKSIYIEGRSVEDSKCYAASILYYQRRVNQTIWVVNGDYVTKTSWYASTRTRFWIDYLVWEEGLVEVVFRGRYGWSYSRGLWQSWKKYIRVNPIPCDCNKDYPWVLDFSKTGWYEWSDRAYDATHINDVLQVESWQDATEADLDDVAASWSERKRPEPVGTEDPETGQSSFRIAAQTEDTPWTER